MRVIKMLNITSCCSKVRKKEKCLFVKSLPFDFYILNTAFNSSFYLRSSTVQEKYKEVKARNSQLLKMLQQGESELNICKRIQTCCF